MRGTEIDDRALTPSQFMLKDVLDLSGRRVITMPAAGNVTLHGGTVTAIVVRHPQDAIEDEHEIVFQTDPPRREYVCFLRGIAANAGPPSDGGAVGTCD